MGFRAIIKLIVAKCVNKLGQKDANDWKFPPFTNGSWKLKYGVRSEHTFSCGKIDLEPLKVLSSDFFVC